MAINTDIINIKPISVTAELFIALNAPRTKTFSASKKFLILCRAVSRADGDRVDDVQRSALN